MGRNRHSNKIWGSGRQAAGFSLYELLVAIALAAIMCGLAIPNVIAWRFNRQLEETARDFQAALQLARLRAVKENAHVVVNFFFEPEHDDSSRPDSYLVFVHDGYEPDSEHTWRRQPGEAIVKSRSLPPNVRIKSAGFASPCSSYVNDGVKVARFDPFGMSNCIGTVELKQGRRIRKIVLSSWGNTRIVKQTED